MSELRWIRLSGIAGIGFVVLTFIAAVLPGPPPAPDAAAAVWRSYYSDHRDAILLAVLLTGLATAVLPLFASGLRVALQRAEGGAGLLAWSAFAAALITTAVAAMGTLLTATLALDPHQEDTVVHVLVTMANVAFPLTNFPWAGLTVSASLVMVATGLFARWLGWAGLAVAAILLISAFGVGATSGPLAGGGSGSIASFMVGAAWLLALSICLLRFDGPGSQ